LTPQKKVAPGPGLAGWLDGNPAPVVMQTDTRQRSAARTGTVPRSAEGVPERDRNFPQSAATSDKPAWTWRDAQQVSSAIRGIRKQLKLDIRTGTIPLEVLVLTPPGEIHKLRVYDVLCWAPRVGLTRARRMARDDDGIIVSETITVGALSEQTRGRLARRIADVLGRS
jgi:hypothetical protein